MDHGLGVGHLSSPSPALNKHCICCEMREWIFRLELLNGILTTKIPFAIIRILFYATSSLVRQFCHVVLRNLIPWVAISRWLGLSELLCFI